MTIPCSTSASTSTLFAACEIIGARMKTPGNGTSPSGQDGGVEPLEIGNAPHVPRPGTKRFEFLDVLTEIALQAEDPDERLRCHGPQAILFPPATRPCARPSARRGRG